MPEDLSSYRKQGVLGQAVNHFRSIRSDRGRRHCVGRIVVHMLLHSFSHQLIHSLGDASGLDRDGIGEYLFPPT